MVKRKKGQPPIFEMKEQCPDAIGISGSTCEINGDMFNRWKLPIPPPEQRLRRIGSRQRNLQDQSLFFRLPAEIRRMIYLELMGYRRVHIRYVWKEPPPFSPQPKYRGRHWNWWHSVCRHSDGFPQEPDYDLCQDWRSEVARNEKNPKINGVEWLRSCQIGVSHYFAVTKKR
ncbi:hypothetical protein N7534_009260 [Penicillium rubens]|nr:hypothetical protein N7534_009260 [Penicillium rubens]